MVSFYVWAKKCLMNLVDVSIILASTCINLFLLICMGWFHCKLSLLSLF
jgi:hypothetical protein